MCNQCNQQNLELLPEFEAILYEFEEELYPEMEFELSQEALPLSRKSKPYIKWVQESLNSILNLKLATDGVLGNSTRSAIRSFQKKEGFIGSSIDGAVGKNTEAALIKAGATSPPGTHVTVTPPVNTCSNKTNITIAFRKFLVDAPSIVSASSRINSTIKPRINAMINDIIQVENLVDISAYSVFSCSKIYNPLVAAIGAQIRAQIDPANKEIWLSDTVWQNANDFRRTEDLSFLADFFSTVAHEKRHATLGSTIQVNSSVLNPGQFTSAAQQAQYRTEEILANAEEIVVSKRIMDVFTVSTSFQQMLRQHWINIQAIVNGAEAKRLRDIIIRELRIRYGFKNNCDNAVTVGILFSMETAKWHVCYSGKIYQNIPVGLNLCKKANGDYQICP